MSIIQYEQQMLYLDRATVQSVHSSWMVASPLIERRAWEHARDELN